MTEQDPLALPDQAPRRSRAPSAAEILAIFLIALGLRLTVMVIVGSPHEASGATAWEWGQEPACIADSLSRGDGYGDPFGRDTGVSAWLTPFYPGLLAGLFRLLGGVGVGAALALFVLQALVSAGTALLVLALGRALGRPRVGRVGAWFFALHPLGVWYAAHQVWDTTWVAAGLTAFLLGLVRARDRGARECILLGLGFGALLMINPAPIGILPIVLLYLAPPRLKREALARAGLFLLGVAIVCAPWSLRNLQALGTPGLRSNMGVELRVGNNDAADGMHQTAHHPGWSDVETKRLIELGEVAYAAESRDATVAWVRDNPRRFARLCLRRAQIFWLGAFPTMDARIKDGVEASKDSRSWMKWVIQLVSGLVAVVGAIRFLPAGANRWLVWGVLALFPLPYYVMHALERYRFPLDPLLALCAAGLLIRFWDMVRGEDEHRAPVTGTLLPLRR
ncbi:MAG: hypothetical protein V3T22_10310 [Planctomycetota bacterium]